MWSNGLHDNVSLEISEETFFINLEYAGFLKEYPRYIMFNQKH